jgi:hypothetical protein
VVQDLPGRPVEMRWLAVSEMHLRDGKVAEVWAIPTDQYTSDEFIGRPWRSGTSLTAARSPSAIGAYMS